MPTNASTHFLNGKFVKEHELVISVRDLGFTRGFAVFDFLITYRRKPFLLEKHIDRLMFSTTEIGLEIPWSKEQLIAWVIETLAQNNDDKEKCIRIILSGGVSDSLIPSNEPTLAIIVDDRHVLSAEQYENGVGVLTIRYTRYTPEAKTNNYIEAVKQAKRAKAVDAIEPMYYDDRQVFEAATSNVFALIDGRLLTPATNILSGITREVLLDILQLDVPIKAENFSIEQLLAADEIFLTGSNKEILPITRIDGKPVGNGVVGNITKEVMKQFRDFVMGSSPTSDFLSYKFLD